MSMRERATPGARRPLWRRYELLLGIAVLILAVSLPYIVDRPRFWLPNIGVKTFWMGIVAMSLVFLNRYVGLISLAQMTIAGICAYGAGYATVTLELPSPAAVLIGLAAGTLAGLITALIAARTRAIYFLMITLALGQVFHSWANQAIEITNARRGLAPIPRPEWGPLDLTDLQTFYYFCLALAIISYLLCRYVASTSFGYALRGIRDSPERMQALGYNVNRYRVAAITFAAFIASLGGIILVFDRNQVTPDIVDLPLTLNILVVAIVGGVLSLGGAFAGGFLVAFLDNYASDFTDRYMTLTGLVFIAVLYFAPTGLAGVGSQLRRLLDRAGRPRQGPPPHDGGEPPELSAAPASPEDPTAAPTQRATTKGMQQ